MLSTFCEVLNKTHQLKLAASPAHELCMSHQSFFVIHYSSVFKSISILINNNKVYVCKIKTTAFYEYTYEFGTNNKIIYFTIFISSMLYILLLWFM